MRLRELADEDWVVLGRAIGGSYTDEVIALCRSAGFMPRIAQETNDVRVLFGLVAAGLGIAMGTTNVRDMSVRGVHFASTSPGVAAALISLAVPNADAPQRRLRPDLVGYALSLMAFGAMEYLVNEGERRNWLDDPSIVIAFVVLVVSAPAFVLWELGASRPYVNFPLFARKRNVAVGAGVNVVLGLAGYSVITFAVYLETQIQATETLAGEMIALRLITYAVGIAAAFYLTKLRLLSVRAMVCLVAFGSALAFVAFGRAMTTTAEAGNSIAISLLFGLFFSMLSQPVPALVLGSLGPGDLPAGLSMYKISSPLGLTIGTGMFQTLFDHRDTLHLTELAGSITPAYTTLRSTSNTAEASER